MLRGSVRVLAHLAFRTANQLMENAQLSDAKLHLYESSDNFVALIMNSMRPFVESW